MAELYVECREDAARYLIKNYADILRDFAAFNFSTRLEVRDKLKEIEKDADERYRQMVQQVEDKYQKALLKYAKNFEKLALFESTYQRYLKTHKESNENSAPFLSALDEKILTIIPAFHNDANKIKNDLVGKTITAQRNGHLTALDSDWAWTIKPEQIVELGRRDEIQQQGDALLYPLRIVLESLGGGQYEADIDVTYVLRRNDDWTIDSVLSRKVEVKKTGQYDNYITSSKGRWGSSQYVNFINNSDVTLLVGGTHLYGGRWYYFARIIPPNGKSRDLSYDEYKIDFIERY
jgi:hypothetical protein